MNAGIPEVTIRDAGPADYTSVARLTVDAYREYASGLSPEMWAQYEADLSDVEGRAREAGIIVAERGGQLVGAVAYFPPGNHQPQWFPSDAGFIRVLAVLPEMRGQGIGRRLTEACIARARVAGAPAIGLMTTELMVVAKGMYERMGFIQQAAYDAGEWRFWTYLLAL